MLASGRFGGILRSCAVVLQNSDVQNATRNCIKQSGNLELHKSFHNIKFFKGNRMHDSEMIMGSKKDPCSDIYKSSTYKLCNKRGPSCDELKKNKASSSEDACAPPKKDLSALPKKEDSCALPKKEDSCALPKKEDRCALSKKEDSCAPPEKKDPCMSPLPSSDKELIVEFGYSDMDKYPELIPWEERCKSKSQNMHFGAGILTMAITTIVTWFYLKP